MAAKTPAFRYSCKYHVVFCPKYRRKVLVGDIETRLKELVKEVCTELNIDLLEMEVMPGHVHLLLEVDPQFGIHKAVKTIKGKSSRALRSEFKSLTTKIPTLLTNSYFVSTAGGAPLSAVTIHRKPENISDTMKKGIRFRAYPNKTQKNLIDRTFGCCRLIYNRGLDMRNNAYAAGEKTGYYQTSAMLTELKKEDAFLFLKEVDSVALQQALRDLDTAFKNFFQKRARYPRFKSKHNNRQSYRTINQKDNIRIVDKYLKLPKVGYLKIKQSMPVGHINNVTVEKTPSGKYFVVLNVDFEPEVRPNAGGVIGIDVGIKEFYSDSNGNSVANPKYLEKSMKKLIRKQRKLSRKKKGSSNRNKQRIKVALTHEKVANQRNDFLHKHSTMLVRENQIICIEDLNVKGMVRNHKLAKAISSASWSKFFTMLEYKAAWYGSDVVRIPTMYPSSQTCSCCGFKNPIVKDLKIRRWDCPKCNAHHDRDTNAAINILSKGLSMTT